MWGTNDITDSVKSVAMSLYDIKVISVGVLDSPKN